MSLNDKEMNPSTVYPGVANPTKANDQTNIDPAANNFMRDPTTPSFGAGADPDRFDGHNQAKRTLREAGGVCEARPGIIDSSNIDPLNENSNKDDGWANATVERPPVSGPAAGTAGGPGFVSQAAAAAKRAYGAVLGDDSTSSKQEPREPVNEF